MNRRRFIKSGFLFTAAPMLLLPRKSLAQQRFGNATAGRLVQIPAAAGGGGSNNVAIVSGHLGGAKVENGSAVTFNFAGATITSGNTLLVGIVLFTNDSSTRNFATSQLTKSAGTATIGTVALDQHKDFLSGGALVDQFGCALYSVPVTGTGTLTLNFAGFAAGEYIMIGAAEFSGVNATPLSTTSKTTGTAATHTTGAITTTDVGVMMYVAYDLGSVDYTRTLSDVLVVKFDTPSTTISGIVQYKIINASPNTLTDTTGAQSNQYQTAYALYKST